MANLKAGTLIGGNLIWNAGNMPLRLSDRRVFINADEFYTTFNKPTPADVGAVNKAGDTMTGRLVISTNAPVIEMNETDNNKKYYIVADGNNFRVNVGDTGISDDSVVYEWNDSGKEFGLRRNLYVKGESRLTTAKMLGDFTLDNKHLRGANNAILLRDHGNGNVTLAASVNSSGTAGDLYLGYNASGHTTRRILMRTETYWGNSAHVLINSEGKLNSEVMYGPIRTEKGSDGIYHTVVGGTDTVNRGRLLLAAGECGKVIHENTTSGDEVVHIGGDAGAGVWIHTGLQSGWGSSGHGRVKFSGGDIYALDGTKRVFRQGWDFGLGGRQGAAANAIDYTEGKTTDFNDLITAGEYSVSGTWKNGVGDPAGSSHTGQVKVEVRHWSAGASYIQTFSYQGTDHLARAVRYGTGTYPNITWKRWVRFGPYETTAEYRVTINRPGETVYPYMSIVKRDKRTDMTSGYYIAGALQFKESPTDENNPDSGRPLFIVRADSTWNQGLNRGILQLRKASDNNTASEVVMYEDNIRLIVNGKASEFKESSTVLPGTLTVGNKIYHNAMTSSNKQVLNANSSDYVYVGNPTVKNLYLETDSDGNVFANAGGSAKRIYHEGYKPSIDALGLTGKIIGAPKTLNKENLDDLKAAGVYAQNSNANTPGLNYPEEKAGTLTVTVAAGVQQRYHVYNTSNIYTRAQYDTGGWTAWRRYIRDDEVNFSSSGAWANVINKIVRVKSDGVMEVGRYIDMHVTDSTKDFDVRMEATANSMKLYNQNGHIEFGPINTSYAHIYTDRPSFYFNKGVTFVGETNIKDGNFVVDGGGRKHIIIKDPAGVDGYIWKDPGQYWEFNHGSKADSKFRWTPNGEFIVFGDRWAATHSHAYAGQPGTLAPIHIEFGAVPGGSDYYPMVRSTSVAASYGYTTQVDLGVIRSGNANWGQGVIRVASHESPEHPQGVFYFDISGNFTAPGNVIAFSDSRVKTNVETITGALDKIGKIRGVTYDRTDITTDRQMGVIAQEVQDIVPEVVNTIKRGDAGDILGVSYGNLVGLLIEGIKELRSELDELRAQVNK